MRKGSILDISFIAVAILGFSMLVIFSYFILSSMSAALTTIPEIPAQAINSLNSFVGYFHFFDIGVAIIFITMFLSAVILARDIPSHPVYFILSILTMIIVVIYVYIIQSIFVEIVTNAVIAPYANAFPIMNTIMGNLPVLSLALFVLISLAIYTGGRMESVSQY